MICNLSITWSEKTRNPLNILLHVDDVVESVIMQLQSFPSIRLRWVLLSALSIVLFVASLRRLHSNYSVANVGPGFVAPDGDVSPVGAGGSLVEGYPDLEKEDHPISRLITTANVKWRHLLEKETRTVAAAADQYRSRRGRHPPPGFAEWFEFAKSRNALVVEDFFDQIYHDTNPFWGFEPHELRRRVRGYAPRITVRQHSTSVLGEGIWTDSWLDLVKTLEAFLPDLDMPINQMDESRMVVPWEVINSLITTEQSSRHLTDPSKTVSEYTSSAEETDSEDTRFFPRFYGPDDSTIWEMSRQGCPPDSKARQSFMPSIDFANPPPELYNYMSLSYQGYVKNITESMDMCIRPEMQALHGTFIEPLSISTTHDAFPLFGGSKLPVNNEILIPPAMYWADGNIYTSGETEHGDENWDAKQDVFLWRGSATGGRNRENNWTGFQRHRLVSMMNSTSVEAAEPSRHAVNFRLPDYKYYGIETGNMSHVAGLLEEHANTGFVHLICFPPSGSPECPHTDPYFAVTPGLPMAEQYAFKYLVDVDGNSFSGRYRSFLGSTSLPIKNAIYKEWHDSRLVPWAHFVPMDLTYMDMYAIMEYFVGSENKKGHDAVARKLAFDGKAWSERVLRRDDMQVYMYRLLLEYARICDDRRETLGYVQDRLDELQE